MKSSETDILLIPGYEGPGPTHWQSRMASKLSTARVVEQQDWSHPSLADAVGKVVAAVTEATRPVVVVAHSSGSLLLAHAMPALRDAGIAERVKGAFIVAPAAPRSVATHTSMDPAFANVPRDPLPFPSVLVASSNDPHTSLEEAADLSMAWGSLLVEAGEAGHINTASGHGPWPEGMMRFAGFLSKLEA